LETGRLASALLGEDVVAEYLMPPAFSYARALAHGDWRYEKDLRCHREHRRAQRVLAGAERFIRAANFENASDLNELLATLKKFRAS